MSKTQSIDTLQNKSKNLNNTISTKAIEADKAEIIDEVNTINKDQLDLLYKMNVSAYKGKPF